MHQYVVKRINITSEQYLTRKTALEHGLYKQLSTLNSALLFISLSEKAIRVLIKFRSQI